MKTNHDSQVDPQLPVSEFGEKDLIRKLVTPLFNPQSRPGGVGDDCAIIDGVDGNVVLVSTDRVPADLIAFRLGIINYWELGRYLAVLNVSDICACGGIPVGLLLNAGLPSSLLVNDFVEICKGFRALAEEVNCQVLGGDISSSSEISLSAVSLGICPIAEVLTRRGARAGDTVFVSKPIGLTPAAFAYYLQLRMTVQLSEGETKVLDGQFQTIKPMPELGRRLAKSGHCSSCMDNTDGLAQSFSELSEASSVAFVVDERKIELDPVVERIAQSDGMDPITLAMGPGADFSLVGTLKGAWSQSKATEVFGSSVRVVGHVEPGNGVYRENAKSRKQLAIIGWNYFVSEVNREK